MSLVSGAFFHSSITVFICPPAKQYTQTTLKIKATLQRLPDDTTIHFTADSWSSVDKEKSKYNSLTASFYDPQLDDCKFLKEHSF